jgi:L-alanine-DL-glutamate epimerase-like enolase superfamily enzyme
MIEIARARDNFEREPLLHPFGFKGGFLTEAWQTAALLQSRNGLRGLGLQTQSVLWSDAEVFARNSESAGNCFMYSMTAFALKNAEGSSFETPIDLLDRLLPITWEYGKRITGNPNLRLTFALNSLVAVDNAAWQLFSAENGIGDFDSMLPEKFRPALSHRHRELACIPLMSYGVPIEEIEQAVDDGFFFLKIKIGSDPDRDGDPEKMLAWDKERLSAIHEAAKDRETPYTESGRIPYYLDANGRYDGKDRLMRLIDHAEKIGALDRIAILEEPFPEDLELDVRDIPVRLAADESAHSDEDALRRIQMGYRSIALKPIAKTMSMSLKIAKIAHDNGIPCFCADLTVNPILVDWNKNVAARLAPLPGMKIGVLETNGHQNYRNWEAMRSYHPSFGAAWTRFANGLFTLDDDFYAESGGIFKQSEHYLGLVK